MAQPKLLGDATQCPTPTLLPGYDLERSKNRRDALRTLFARFIAGSGASLDEERMRFIADWLEEREFSLGEFQRASEWIMRGNPVRFGTLTTADFYPTPEQLASIDFRDDTESRIRAAEQRGYERGYRDGDNKPPCQKCHEEQSLRFEITKLELKILELENGGTK